MDLKNSDLFQWLSIDWFAPSTLRDFHWENPFMFYFFLAIPLVFIIRWIISLKSKSKLAVSFPENVLSKDPTAYLRLIPYIVLSIVLALIVTALARPQRTTERIEQITKGIDIMLVIDISKSMEMMDLRPNRLEATKKTAKSFINGRLEDRIGIVVFSGEAFSLSPLTTDYNLLKSYINEIKFSMMDQGGTAIGSALAVALNRLKESQADSKVIVLLSDGDNNAGNIDPMTAAKLASAYGIKAYTILAGVEKGKVPVGKDIFGNTQYVDVEVDAGTLRRIAEITNGRFFRAANNKALEEIFGIIDQLEKTEVKINRYKNIKDYYDVYLMWAIMFFIAWIALKVSFVNNFLID
jgi:Ca-activated chloride channel family protein